VGARGAPRGASGETARGQHLLRSDDVARELIQQADIGPDELVVEVGPGSGRLTGPLSEAARRVIAVEIDRRFAASLRARYGHATNVEIVRGDILRVPLPETPFRAVGNLPFAATTPILRRLLDDPAVPMTAADLLVEANVARKRASPRPTNLVSLGWQPWWEFRLVRQLPASAFEPRPSVDAGFLAIRRRSSPLLPAEARPAYRAMLVGAFRRGNMPVERAVRTIPPGVIATCLRGRGLARGARPAGLDVFDWVALFEAAQAGPQKSSSAMPSGSRKLRPDP
jgi:23S rRNA (adenine-N6)-dimethyltransferase